MEIVDVIFMYKASSFNTEMNTFITGDPQRQAKALLHY